MKLKLYKLFNALWFLAVVLTAVGFAWTGISGNFAFILVFLLFIPCLCIGSTAATIEKKYKNDYLISLGLGVTTLIFALINTIHSSANRYGPWFYPFSLIPLILIILQLIFTAVTMFGAEGKLFSKEKSKEATVSNYTSKSLKTLLYVVAYLLMITYISLAITSLTSSRGLGFSIDLIQDYIYLYALLLLVLVCAVSLLGSFAFYLMGNRNGKAFRVFTTIALSTFFATYTCVGSLLFWGFVVVSIVIIASTLAPKEKVFIKKNKAHYILLIGIGVMSLLVYATMIYIKAAYYYQPYSRDYAKIDIWVLMFSDSRYFYGPISTINYLLVPRGLVLLPLGVAVFALIKKNIDKKLLERILLASIIWAAICATILIIYAIFQLKFVIYMGAYPSSYSELPPLTLEQRLPAYMGASSYAILLIALIVTFVYVKRGKCESVETSIIQESTTAANKKVLVLDIVRKIVLVAASFMFALLIPVCFDGAGIKVNAMDFCGGSIMGAYEQPPIVINYSPLATLCYTLILISLLMPIVYTIYYFAYYQKNKLFSRIFGYAVCGQQILLHAIFISVIIISNKTQGTSFSTLSFIPVIFSLISMVVLTLDIYKKRFNSVFATYKEKAEARKQEKEAERQRIMEEKQKEREMKEAIIRQKRAQAEKEREENMKYQAALEAKEREEERQRELEEKKERERQLLKYKNTETKSPSESKIRQLQDLVNLKESGAITDEEFAQLKAEVLKGGNNDEI